VNHACTFPPYPNKLLSIPHGPNKSPRHIICPNKAHFLVPSGAYVQEGDFLPSPRWINAPSLHGQWEEC